MAGPAARLLARFIDETSGPACRNEAPEALPMGQLGLWARPLSTSAPLQPGHEEQPRLPREETRLLPFPPPAPSPTAADRAVYASFAFCALNASGTDGEMLPIFILLHCV